MRQAGWLPQDLRYPSLVTLWKGQPAPLILTSLFPPLLISTSGRTLGPRLNLHVHDCIRRERFVTRRTNCSKQSTCSGKAKTVVASGCLICFGQDFDSHWINLLIVPKTNPGSLLEMQTLKIHPRPTESEPAVQQVPLWVLCTLRLETAGLGGERHAANDFEGVSKRTSRHRSMAQNRQPACLSLIPHEGSRPDTDYVPIRDANTRLWFKVRGGLSEGVWCSFLLNFEPGTSWAPRVPGGPRLQCLQQLWQRRKLQQWNVHPGLL